MMTLRDKTGLLPGGIMYQDPRTGSAVWYDTHSFLEDRVVQVVNFRKANPTVYPEAEWTTPAFVRQQLIDFNCQRIGFNPEFCVGGTDGPIPAPAGVPQVSDRVCPTCGAGLVPMFCKTCGGARVTGYQCLPCKKEYPK